MTLTEANSLLRESVGRNGLEGGGSRGGEVEVGSRPGGEDGAVKGAGGWHLTG